MKNKIVVVIAAALVGVPIAEAMSAGPTDASAPVGNRPAKTEAISGTNIKKITLTEKAAQRLDIKTVDVRQDASGARIVPYAALFYDKDGSTWVYTNPQPLTFIRARVTVDKIQTEDAIVKDGPAAGVKVVTVGVPELYGAERGVGH
jgi:hypothetical protein